tara:strand:- start:109 stop:357 length:249 start_codon:yes stop_codon:yes gene_type:complete
MKIDDIIGESITSGGFASVAMPLFTGEKGKKHHKKARRAVGLEGNMKMGYDADNPGYKHVVRDVYPMIRRIKRTKYGTVDET